MSNSSSKPPTGMTQEEWDKHLQIDKLMKEQRKKRFEQELREKPPLPPWIKYPEYHPTSLFWRMGMGETYLMEYVWVYFEYASAEEITKYKSKYPAPKDWKAIYDENET